jgi:DNA-binding NarL/FixJ family response regulator
VAKTVLVVDDEPDLRTLLCFLLEIDGRCDEIAQAEDAPGALREAIRAEPDAVILDFMLGEVTAAEVLPQLRATCPDARIVVFTAAPESAQAADVIARGADIIAAKATESIDHVIDLTLLDA